MSTLEYTVSMLQTMPEEKLKEVQNFIQYLLFRDGKDAAMEMLSEDELVDQLTTSMEKSDMGAMTSASEVSQRMREKYAL